MIRPLCVFCGLRPVKGRRPEAKRCALCTHKRPSRNVPMELKGWRDISAVQIDALYLAARARQQRTKWRAA